MKKLFHLFLFIALPLSLYGQGTKQEQEQRIAPNLVPEASQTWLNEAFSDLPKVKWYREITSGKTSYEAKFKWEGARYSVEFDEDGKIEDVERKVKLSDLSESHRVSLEKGFAQFKKFSLVKVQEQWTASSSEGLKSAIQQNDPAMVTIRFEVEFKAAIDGRHTLWEGLFDTSGQLISKRQVVLRPTDNLDYD